MSRDSMDNPWWVHSGYSVDYPWMINPGKTMDNGIMHALVDGYSMDYPRIAHGWSMNRPSIRGLSMDYPWIVHG